MPAARGRNGSSKVGELEKRSGVNAMALFTAVMAVGEKAKVR
jgi:hypothetical protein